MAPQTPGSREGFFAGWPHVQVQLIYSGKWENRYVATAHSLHRGPPGRQWRRQGPGSEKRAGLPGAGKQVKGHRSSDGKGRMGKAAKGQAEEFRLSTLHSKGGKGFLPRA